MLVSVSTPAVLIVPHDWFLACKFVSGPVGALTRGAAVIMLFASGAPLKCDLLFAFATNFACTWSNSGVDHWKTPLRTELNDNVQIDIRRSGTQRFIDGPAAIQRRHTNVKSIYRVHDNVQMADVIDLTCTGSGIAKNRRKIHRTQLTSFIVCLNCCVI